MTLSEVNQTVCFLAVLLLWSQPVSEQLTLRSAHIPSKKRDPDQDFSTNIGIPFQNTRQGDRSSLSFSPDGCTSTRKALRGYAASRGAEIGRNPSGLYYMWGLCTYILEPLRPRRKGPTTGALHKHTQHKGGKGTVRVVPRHCAMQ